MKSKSERIERLEKFVDTKTSAQIASIMNHQVTTIKKLKLMMNDLRTKQLNSAIAKRDYDSKFEKKCYLKTTKIKMVDANTNKFKVTVDPIDGEIRLKVGKACGFTYNELLNIKNENGNVFDQLRNYSQYCGFTYRGTITIFNSQVICYIKTENSYDRLHFIINF